MSHMKLWGAAVCCVGCFVVFKMKQQSGAVLAVMRAMAMVGSSSSAKSSKEDTTSTYTIVSPLFEQDLNITSVISDITFVELSTTIMRIEVKEEILMQLTRNLYKPRTIPNEQQCILQSINGIIVRKESNFIYTFVGFLDIPNYFIHSFFHGGLLVSKSFCDGATPYSIPFSEERDNQDATSYRKQCFRAYIEGTGLFTSRSRGEYYCIFKNNGKLMACSKNKLYSLNDTTSSSERSDELDLYTREALLFIYSVSGIDFEKLSKGDNVSNHTEHSYVLACVRNKTSVFHNSGYSNHSNDGSNYGSNYGSNGSFYDVHYITSSLSSSFYLSQFKRKEKPIFFREDVEKKNVPCSNPLWMKHFIGFNRNIGNSNDTSSDGRYLKEHHSLEVYLTDLRTTVVFSTEREFIIDMLTLESTQIFDVYKKILLFYKDKVLNYRQYQIKWNDRYSTPHDLAKDLFPKCNELLMITEKYQNATASNGEIDVKLVRGFIRKLFGNKTLIHIVKEKVEKQITAGECFYEIPNVTGRVGRIYISQYENVFVGTKCYGTISKTIDSALYNIRFLCNVNNNSSNRSTSSNGGNGNNSSSNGGSNRGSEGSNGGSVLYLEPSSVTVAISSVKDKIVSFIYTLVTQCQMKGSLDLDEANEASKSLTSQASSASHKSIEDIKRKLENEIQYEQNILLLKSKVHSHRQRTVVIRQEIEKGKVMTVTSEDTKMSLEDELKFLELTIRDEEAYLEKEGRPLDTEYTRVMMEIQTINDLIETRTNPNERKRLSDEKLLLEAQLKEMLPEASNIERKQKELERLKFQEATTKFDKTSPINRVRIPDPLLEKIILKIEYDQDVTISIGEIEEYIQSLGRKSDEFVCSVHSNKGITVEEDVDNFVIRSSLLGETFTIPQWFKLVSVYDEVDVVRTINDFEQMNVKRFDKTLQPSMLCLLFAQYGYDYTYFESLPSNSLERSDYLFKLYRTMVNWKKETLIDLKSNNDKHEEPLSYVSMLNDNEYNWKPLLHLK
jgi:hypothetical protein